MAYLRTRDAIYSIFEPNKEGRYSKMLTSSPLISSAAGLPP